jgi:nuclear pore complex protein Nup107
MAKQHEYYSLDATYRGWLRCEMENSSVPPEMLSAEEKDQAVAAATQTLELAFLLLLSKLKLFVAPLRHKASVFF